MRLQTARVLLWAVVEIAISSSMAAQSNATLSGAATDASGKPIAHAHVSLRPANAARERETETEADGNYSFADLAPGNYIIWASTDTLQSREIQVTVTNVPRQTLDLVLNPVAPAAAQPALPSAPNPPPSQAPVAPSLEDLGFSAQQTQSDPKLQATLERHTRMLKIHQKLGLITAIPMAAAVITGPMAKAKGRNGETIKEPTTANLDFHAAVGGLTTALYFTTAYYAIFAPRVPNNPKHGAIRLHEALAFIHGPGMIATPILGYMAYHQENSGEKVHGIASAHAPVAYATTIAYGSAIVAISWPIHWKFWEK